MSPVFKKKYSIDNLNKVGNTRSNKLKASEWFQLGVKLQKEDNQLKTKFNENLEDHERVQSENQELLRSSESSIGKL